MNCAIDFTIHRLYDIAVCIYTIIIIVYIVQCVLYNVCSCYDLFIYYKRLWLINNDMSYNIIVATD